jgi:hypothetical protein
MYKDIILSDNSQHCTIRPLRVNRQRSASRYSNLPQVEVHDYQFILLQFKLGIFLTTLLEGVANISLRLTNTCYSLEVEVES